MDNPRRIAAKDADYALNFSIESKNKWRYDHKKISYLSIAMPK